jgi:hypothetical protein
LVIGEQQGERRWSVRLEIGGKKEYVLLSVKKGNEGRTRESIRVWGFKPSQAGAKFKKRDRNSK